MAIITMLGLVDIRRGEKRGVKDIGGGRKGGRRRSSSRKKSKGAL